MPPVQAEMFAHWKGAGPMFLVPRGTLHRLSFRHISPAQVSYVAFRAKQIPRSARNDKLFSMPLTDKFGRAITDLRVSITDRCNYKCVYCRTGNEGAQYADLPMADYLRMVRVLVSLGIEKVRLTGGEPLLRKGVVEFVRELAALRTLSGDKLDI